MVHRGIFLYINKPTVQSLSINKNNSRVCVRERERENERDSQTDRQTGTGRQTDLVLWWTAGWPPAPPLCWWNWSVTWRHPAMSSASHGSVREAKNRKHSKQLFSDSVRLTWPSCTNYSYWIWINKLKLGDFEFIQYICCICQEMSMGKIWFTMRPTENNSLNLTT